MILLIYALNSVHFAFSLSSHKLCYEKISITEQGGIRPVLVIQYDTGNRYSPTVIIAAITSSLEKAKLPTHVQVESRMLEKCSIVLLEQVRTIDKCRLAEYIDHLEGDAMKRIDQAIEISFGLNYLEGLRG